jgi:hypothetical protein
VGNDVTVKAGDKITVFGWHAGDGTRYARPGEINVKGKILHFGNPD